MGDMKETIKCQVVGLELRTYIAHVRQRSRSLHYRGQLEINHSKTFLK